MNDKRRAPPRSVWTAALEEVKAEIREQAKAEGLAVWNDGVIKDLGQLHPSVWSALLKALDILEETVGNEASKEAAAALDKMLDDPIASEALVAELVAYDHLAGDPIAGAREKLGDWKRIAERNRIKATRQRLRDLDQEVLAIGDQLRLAALGVEHREGAPRATGVRNAVSKAWLALRQLDEIAAQAERAAPLPMGRPEQTEVRARERLMEGLCRIYIDAGHWGADDAFWELCRAIWEAHTGKEDIPGLRNLKKKISDNF